MYFQRGWLVTRIEHYMVKNKMSGAEAAPCITCVGRSSPFSKILQISTCIFSSTEMTIKWSSTLGHRHLGRLSIEKINNHDDFSCDLKGALSQGFCCVQVNSVLQSLLSNFTHIAYKGALSRGFCCVQVNSVLQSLLSTFTHITYKGALSRGFCCVQPSQFYA